tara:strand:- start:360 stop:2096 length:1737 start_codon:yes stop_codon:yes gene_type:complete
MTIINFKSLYSIVILSSIGTLAQGTMVAPNIDLLGEKLDRTINTIVDQHPVFDFSQLLETIKMTQVAQDEKLAYELQSQYDSDYARELQHQYDTEDLNPPALPKPQLSLAFLDVLKELKKSHKPKSKLGLLAHVTNLNDISDAIYKTPTGAYLKYRYAHADIEVSVKKAVHRLLRNIKRDQYNKKSRLASNAIVSALNSNFYAVEKEVLGLVRNILISSVEDPEYYTLYHGHGNGLRLYVDMLRQVKSYENLVDLSETNPLRDKTIASDIRNVSDILERYNPAAKEYAAENGLQLRTDKRTLGFNFAPDKIGLLRDHAVCVNTNLFGNTEILAECTLFYFLDSFNISNPNEILVKNLLARIVDPEISENNMAAKIKRYTDLYDKHMKSSGGNLMEIKIRKGKFTNADEKVRGIDDIAFASWMKGIPVWLTKKSGKLATRGGNEKAVRILNEAHNLYVRPKMSDYLELNISDPPAFVEKYSNFRPKDHVTQRQREKVLDRTQARVVIDPVTFNDGENILVNQYTRFEVPQEDKEAYESELQKLIKEDMQEHLERLQNGSGAVSERGRLGRLLGYISCAA